MGSERGDGYKKPCSLGEGTGTKVSDDSEAPQRAKASRRVPTHHNVQHYLLLEKVAKRVRDDQVMRLLKMILKATGKKAFHKAV